MTGRRLFLSHLWRMTITALAGFLELRQLSLNRHDVFVGDRLVIVMTRSATDNRHVRCQAAQRAGPSNIYVTGRALNHMVAAFAAAFVAERL